MKALYYDTKSAPLALLAIWLVQQSFTVWLLIHGQAVTHEENVDRACTMIFANVGEFPPSLSAWIPLVYDTVAVILVLFKCIPQKKVSMSRIYDTLIRDGILYYGVLFGVNFVLGTMIIVAPVRSVTV